MFDNHKNNIVVLLTLGKSKKYCRFVDFGQVKNIVVFTNFGQLKKIYSFF